MVWDKIIALSIGFAIILFFALGIDLNEISAHRLAPIRVRSDESRRKIAREQNDDTVNVYRLDILLMVGLMVLFLVLIFSLQF